MLRACSLCTCHKVLSVGPGSDPSAGSGNRMRCRYSNRWNFSAWPKSHIAIKQGKRWLRRDSTL
jgi:hypothetical protein